MRGQGRRPCCPRPQCGDTGQLAWPVAPQLPCLSDALRTLLHPPRAVGSHPALPQRPGAFHLGHQETLDGEGLCPGQQSPAPSLPLPEVLDGETWSLFSSRLLPLLSAQARPCPREPRCGSLAPGRPSSRPASSHLRLLSVNWGEGSLLPCLLALVGGLQPPGSLCIGHVAVPREPGAGLRRRVRGDDRGWPTGPPEGPLSMEVRGSPQAGRAVGWKGEGPRLPGDPGQRPHLRPASSHLDDR